MHISGHPSDVRNVLWSVLQDQLQVPYIPYNLQNVFSKSLIHNFADNNNLLCSSEKLRTIEFVMNHELKLLAE